MKIAELKCLKDMIITGRNEDGSPDLCFMEGKDYLFSVDEKKAKTDLLTINEVKEVHILKLDDSFTNEYFEVLKVADDIEFNLDEFTLKKMRKLYKERYSYSE